MAHVFGNNPEQHVRLQDEPEEKKVDDPLKGIIAKLQTIVLNFLNNLFKENWFSCYIR